MEDITPKSQKPRSQAQIEASRNNGRKSKGPITEAGKAISSQNAVDHGLAATRWIVPSNEDPATFDYLLAEYSGAWHPADPIERDLVRQMAHAQYNLERAWIMETAAFDHEMDSMEATLNKTYSQIDPPTVQSLAFASLAKDGPTLPLLDRYQARLERSFHRALHTLLTLRKAKAAAERAATSSPRRTNPSRLSATGIQARMRVDSLNNPAPINPQPPPSPDPIDTVKAL